MDMNRYTEIDGLKAVKMFLEGEELFSEEGQKYRIDPTFNKLYHVPWAHETLSNLTFNEIVSRKWYVKKPFDVRTEMLARPNEWVGAFKNSSRWLKVGFRTDVMYPVATPYWGDSIERVITRSFKGELDHCIPIEDVPKEEL